MWSISPGPSILIVLSGTLELACNGVTDKLHRGSVIFLPSGREAKFYPKEEEEALLFQAYCSLWWLYIQQIDLSRYLHSAYFLFAFVRIFGYLTDLYVCVICSLIFWKVADIMLSVVVVNIQLTFSLPVTSLHSLHCGCGYMSFPSMSTFNLLQWNLLYSGHCWKQPLFAGVIVYKVTCIKQPPVDKGPQKCWSHGNYIRSVSLYAISQLSGSITVSPHSLGGLRLQLTRFVCNISIAVVWQPSLGKTNKQTSKQTTTATMQLFGNLHQSKQTSKQTNKQQQQQCSCLATFIIQNKQKQCRQ